MSERRDSYKKVAKNILHLIAKHYSYLALREEEFKKASSALQNRVDKIKDDEKFIKHVLKSLFIMRDPHIRIVDGTGKGIGTHEFKKRKNYNGELLKKYFKGKNNNKAIVSRKKGNLIYIRIGSLADRYRSDLEKMYREINFGKYHKWIIDLRANKGGNDSLANRLIKNLAGLGDPFISSHARFRTNEKNPKQLSEFTPNYVFPGKKYQQKDIVVLIGNNTYSSAELVTMDLAAIPGTVLIGDITGGGSARPERYLVDGPLVGKKIDNNKNPLKHKSRFALDIPSWLKYRLDQFLLQDRGIAPHIFIPASKSIIGKRDIVLEKALEFHRNPLIC
ncbi:MAG: hypothetical protein KJ718_01635 [Nanoarchaeota archaeon]|nr:hypothetical protein [Nanoarchaeota archaeon]